MRAAIRILCLALTLTAAASAQGPDPATRAERARLEAEGVSAFNRRDYPAAERAFRAWHELRPDDWIPLYNLATVVSLQDRGEDAAGLLAQAVERGFVDFRRLGHEGAMQRLAGTETVRDILTNWRAKQDAAIDRRIEQARRGFDRGYRYEKDEVNRLAFASGFSASAFDRVREEIERLSRFFREHVLPEGEVLVQAEGDRPEPWVMVILPTPADYSAWAKRNYGPRWQQIGGVYDNDRLELVAKDLGPTFRHEFLHVLHWRHINRAGRSQPAWVMEGLCSLVEDVRIGDNGELVPVASWRTNTAKRMLTFTTRPRLADLLTRDDASFTSDKPLANYALARAFFLYLFERGVLRPWYAEYTATIREDRSGRAALERVLERDLDAIERDFFEWLRALGTAPEADSPPDAALPVTLGASAGDGLRIRSSSRSVGGLRPGDVITAVAGRSVADLNELHGVLAGLSAGDEVDVAYRRGTREGATKVRLVAR